MILHLLLRTLSLSCCSSCSKPSQLQHQHQHQHQAELLTFLREWSGQEKEVTGMAHLIHNNNDNIEQQ